MFGACVNFLQHCQFFGQWNRATWCLHFNLSPAGLSPNSVFYRNTELIPLCFAAVIRGPVQGVQDCNMGWFGLGGLVVFNTLYFCVFIKHFVILKWTIWSQWVEAASLGYHILRCFAAQSLGFWRSFRCVTVWNPEPVWKCIRLKKSRFRQHSVRVSRDSSFDREGWRCWLFQGPNRY